LTDERANHEGRPSRDRKDLRVSANRRQGDALGVAPGRFLMARSRPASLRSSTWISRRILIWGRSRWTSRRRRVVGARGSNARPSPFFGQDERAQRWGDEQLDTLQRCASADRI